MPRYWVCNRCGTYNLDVICETCQLPKEEAIAYEEIRDEDPLDEDLDQDDWLLTSIIEEEDDYDEW
jgi:hypothetical protein